MDFPVFAGLPVSIFIDGYAGSNGTFTLDVDVSNAICGNGVAELPEACDDGNLTGGDGCSATCTLDALGALDVCPGQPFVLSGPPGAARKISFSGNTNTQGDTTESAPGSFFGGGKNVIYAVKSDVTGSAKVDLLASYAKSELYARSDCASNTYQLGAADADRPGTSSIELPVSAGQWFYLFVDGKGGGTAKAFGGPFSLDVAVTPAACGNHRLDGDEQCDDGNAEAGDGCSATCTREPLAGLDTCPGHAVTLAPQADGSRTAVVSGTTAGLANDVSGCQSLLSASAPDAIFAVTPDIDGLLQLDVSGPFNSTVSVLDSCAPPAGARTSVLACSYAVWFPAAFGDSDPYVLDGSGSGPKSTGAPVIAGRTYYVVVDGAVSSGGASSGPFELRMRLTAPTCGNGVIEGAETCDDGALDDNDGCSATCQLEPTGPRNTCASADDVPFAETTPGTWNAAVKSGTTNLTAVQNFGSSEISAGVCWARGRDAFFKVTAPASGVLRATAKSDAFDVILGLRQPVCATTTAPTACSNDGPKGVDEIVTTTVAAGDVLYLVVDTPLLDVNGCTAPISSSFAADCAKLEETGLFTLDVSISPSGCGDGFFVASATEQCDDGNLVSGDGCSATCTIEPTAGVDTCPGAPLALTGAGTQPRRGSITIDTSTLNGDYSGACGGSSKEGVVRVTAPMNGTLTAKVRNMLGATVYARAICIDPSSELLKTSGATCPNVVQDVVSFPVTAGADYFLFVDGLDGAVGVPTLDVTVAP
jgi:cysteine-rich repeat protein